MVKRLCQLADISIEDAGLVEGDDKPNLGELLEEDLQKVGHRHHSWDIPVLLEPCHIDESSGAAQMADVWSQCEGCEFVIHLGVFGRVVVARHVHRVPFV